LIYQSRTPPRSNASTQLHLGLHFKHWRNCNQKYSKQNQETTTPMLCRFDKMLLESSKTHYGRINHQFFLDLHLSYLPESSETLWLSDGSVSDENCVIFLISPTSKQIPKMAFIQKFLLSLIWLANYLIDYREYIFTSFVSYSQLIH